MSSVRLLKRKSSSFEKKFLHKKHKAGLRSIKNEDKVYKNRIDESILTMAIRNLNLAREGRIGLNDLNLEEIYKDKQEFEMDYFNVQSDEKYETFKMFEVIWPREKYADHLLMIIAQVFSHPGNCGYFTTQELNLIFSLMTLSREAQQMFVRLYKRKLSWHRVTDISYKDVANDLKPYFDELVENKFCTYDTSKADVSELLELLKWQEVQKICRNLKVKAQGNKPDLIKKLLKGNGQKKSFFIGAKAPADILREMIEGALDKCVLLLEDIINLFDMVLMLLDPVQNFTNSIADLLVMVNKVHYEDIVFPCKPKKYWPIFKSRLHLISFINGKKIGRNLLNALETKDWDSVKRFGMIAYLELKKFDTKEECDLPVHIKQFLPEQIWFEIALKSVESFKKSEDTMHIAVEILKTLIQFNDSPSLYNQLALIEMHHRKDLETSASLSLQLLKNENVSIVDVRTTQSRIKKLLKQKSGLSQETQMSLKDAEEIWQEKYPYEATSVNMKIISAKMAKDHKIRGRSAWLIGKESEESSFVSVEILALRDYVSTENFTRGIHCEGSLPVSLFTTLFWDVLYDDSVPGAFISPFQDGPLDLYSTEFCENRKQEIKEKLQYYEKMDLIEFGMHLKDKYLQYRKFKSLLPLDRFTTEESAQNLQEIASCLGMTAVIKIAEKLLSDFATWQFGFPDLVLWNVSTSKCKIVEVKGPKDSLSIKQRLWLEHLRILGIDVEICLVQDSTKDSTNNSQTTDSGDVDEGDF